MQKDMSITVHEDQEKFDKISENVDGADKSVELGTEDLEATAKATVVFLLRTLVDSLLCLCVARW